VNYAYRECLENILDEGFNVSPRGQQTKEILNYSFTLEDPLKCVLESEARGLNYAFMVAEWLWILYGREDLKFISSFNKNIANYSDDGKTLAGAYGPRINSQLEYVVKTLSNDRNSRQAIISIWKPNPGSSKDLPCTMTLQFLIRRGKLHLIVNMRSNDAFLGLPYDVFTFCQLMNVVSSMLQVGLGEYHHNAGSMHLYKQHLKSAKMIVAEDTLIKIPRLTRIKGYSLKQHETLKKAFNQYISDMIIKGHLTYLDSAIFPEGIREHLHFLNNYCSSAKTHKNHKFWSKFYI